MPYVCFQWRFDVLQYSTTDADAWVHRQTESEELEDGPRTNMVIADAATNTFMGQVSVEPMSDVHYCTMEIGYCMREGGREGGNCGLADHGITLLARLLLWHRAWRTPLGQRHYNCSLESHDRVCVRGFSIHTED